MEEYLKITWSRKDGKFLSVTALFDFCVTYDYACFELKTKIDKSCTAIIFQVLRLRL